MPYRGIPCTCAPLSKRGLQENASWPENVANSYFKYFHLPDSCSYSINATEAALFVVVASRLSSSGCPDVTVLVWMGVKHLKLLTY